MINLMKFKDSQAISLNLNPLELQNCGERTITNEKKKKGRQNSACFQPNLGNFHNNFHLKLKLHKVKLKIVG